MVCHARVHSHSSSANMQDVQLLPIIRDVVCDYFESCLSLLLDRIILAVGPAGSNSNSNASNPVRCFTNAKQQETLKSPITKEKV